MPAPQEAPPLANSLWRPGSRTFLRDQRAAQVGDLITILVSIDDEAQLQNRTQRSRTGTERMGVPNLLGLEASTNRILPNSVSPDRLVNTNSAGNSDGTGSVRRNEQVTLRLAGVITQTLPNGNMVVMGRQEVRVNNELRELTVQANSAALGRENREQIATELTQLKTQLFAIANTNDGLGHYVFGGTQDGSAPFAEAGAGASYGGTQSVRALPVGEGRLMPEGDSGDAVFLRIPRAAGGNADLFTRVQLALDAVQGDTSTPAARAANQTAFSDALAALDEGIEHVSTVRASVGARLATLDGVEAHLEGLDVQLQTTLSEVRDLDYAESISRLQLHTLSLQAAQAAFAKVQGLSLFNVLR
jgi:hypothetical protein